MKELVKIQRNLKARKDLYNNFAKFAYRSAESILEALKPLLEEAKCSVILSDEVVEVGQPYVYDSQDQKKGVASHFAGTRVYVVSTATIINEAGEMLSVKGWARENVEKAGMDVAQITGSASSYARKYALCGLFAIDDGRDMDSASVSPITQDKLKGDLDKAKKKIDGCKTRAELQSVNEKCQSLWNNQEYINYLTMKYNTLQR